MVRAPGADTYSALLAGGKVDDKIDTDPDTADILARTQAQP